MKRLCSASAAILLAFSIGMGGAHAAVITVPATADLFSAGQATASVSRGGTLPVVVGIPAGTNRFVVFNSVSGLVETDAAGTNPNLWSPNGPDGATTMSFGTRWTNIASASGIAGVKCPTFMFLAGVFLDDTTPVAGTEPQRLDFNTLGLSFTELHPLLRQSFFMGDGLTGTGTGQTQRFYVPDGATRLVLGIEDAWDMGWPATGDPGGTPGYYSDNGGAFVADVSVVPEPSLVGPSILGMAALICRRRRQT